MRLNKSFDSASASLVTFNHDFDSKTLLSPHFHLKALVLFINMGTLTDITAKTNNAIVQQSSNSAVSQAAKFPATGETLGKSKSPHFMSPTVSSTKQSITTWNKSKDDTPTPPSLASGKGNSWMVTAAKRVGIKRSGDGTPRSRKEGLKKQPKTPSALTFPDKVGFNLCHSCVPSIDTDIFTSWLHLRMASC